MGAAAAVIPPLVDGPGGSGRGGAVAAQVPVSAAPVVVDFASPVTERDGDEVAVAEDEGGTTTFVDGGAEVWQGAPVPDVGRFALVEDGGTMSAEFVAVEPRNQRSGFGGALMASSAPEPVEQADEFVPTFAEDSLLGALTRVEERGRRAPVGSAAPSGFQAQAEPLVVSPALAYPDGTATGDEGRTFEVAAPAVSHGPGDVERAWEEGVGAPAAGTSATAGAGVVEPDPAPEPVVERVVEVVDDAVEAVRHPVETVGNVVEWVGGQAGRARRTVERVWDGMPWNR